MAVTSSTMRLDSAELVIKMQRRHLDGDVGNGGRIRREAAAEGVEIGQSSGAALRRLRRRHTDVPFWPNEPG
jgi:hypothetical protein